MASFKKAIFDLLSDGQELSGAEKSQVNQEVEKFIKANKSKLNNIAGES